MKDNNGERLNIFLRLKNRFDYAEFKAACESSGVAILQPIEYANKAGIVSCALVSHPEMSPLDAYTAFIIDNPFVAIPIATTPTSKNGCTNCGSTGLGDTIAKITHNTGLDKLSELYTKITGKDCGCTSRQEALNKLFPYGVKEDVV